VDEKVSNGDDAPVRAVTRADDAIVVTLAGELDLYNASDVREALHAATTEQPGRLIVDLAQVEFLDSTILGVLVEARSHLQNRRACVLVAPGVEARRALEVSGLDKHFAVHESVEAALAAPL
jgi:anti-sigma B factor antagonist